MAGGATLALASPSSRPQGCALGYAALTGELEPFGPIIYALPLAALAGVLVPILMVVTRQNDAFAWSIVSLCVTVFGLFIGFFLWLAAATIGCGGPEGCLG